MAPFRDTVTGLTAGTTYSLTISWEALKGGTHAYDYITMILQQIGSQSPVYTDIITGYTYQIVFVNGVLSQKRLT